MRRKRPKAPRKPVPPLRTARALSTRSSAEGPSPDASLADAGEAYSHRGLTYPLGRGGPGEGEIIALADGIGSRAQPTPSAVPS